MTRSELRRLIAWLAALAFIALMVKAVAAVELAKPEIHGLARFKAARDETQGLEQNRLTQTLRLDARQVFWDKFSFNLDLRNEFRYDKTPAAQTRQDYADALLAYATLDRLPFGTSVRLGRQYFYGAETTWHVDGAAAEWRGASWLQIGGFSGRPVVLGRRRGAALAENLQGGSIRLGRGRKGSVDLSAVMASHAGKYAADREVQAAVFRRMTDTIDLRGSYSSLNNAPKSASARLQWRLPESMITVTPHYYKQLLVADPASEALSPYARTMAHFRRFERYGINFSKAFAAGVSLSGGGDLYLPDQRREYRAGVSASNILSTGFDAGVSASRSLVESRSTLALSAYAGYRLGAGLELSTGTSLNESKDSDPSGFGGSKSQTYYADLKWSGRKGREVRLSPSMVRTTGLSSPIYRVELTNGWRF